MNDFARTQVRDQARGPRGLTQPVKAKLTAETTRYLAAEVVARPNFPARSELPKPLPPTFFNFGHQILVDYPRLVRTVWTAAVEVKRAVGRFDFYFRKAVLGGLAVAALMIFGCLTHMEDPSAAAMLVALIVLALPWLAILGWRGRRLKMKVAGIRAQVLRRLLNDEFREDTSLSIEVPGALVGDGALGTERVPVITTLDAEQPFEGFGQLKADKLFTCRPKDGERPLPVEHLEAQLRDEIVAKVGELGLGGTTFGDVVVVDGASLSIRSGWLGANRSPVLWVAHEQLQALDAVDPHASVRRFLAVQLLSPEDLTAITFFIRAFTTGNSASFQVAVTTLGPPEADLEYLLNRLHKYGLEREVEREKQKRQREWQRLSGGTKNEALKERWRALMSLDASTRGGMQFQGSVPLDDIVHLDLTKETERSGEYEAKLQQIVSQTECWPARLYQRTRLNWRQERSRDFPVDFFGRPEALAAVRTTYDQIVRAILTFLEQAGFDISDYRNKDGQYNIKADSIGNLIVGENVSVGGDKSKAAPAGKGATKAAS